jgi:heptaprenyl diphosphate synthase
MAKIFFFDPVAEELEIVEEQLLKIIDSEVRIVNQASRSLMKAGGKRMRPAFALLAAKLFQEDLTRVRPLAVALEMVHLASLIHDDVVDNSMLRRGIETVKSKWGNRVSIYSGNIIGILNSV